MSRDFTDSNHLKIASSMDQLHVILKWLRSKLQSTLMRESEIKKIEIAVEEVTVNIMKHAYSNVVNLFEIEWVITNPDYIQIQFKDFGKAFNPLTMETLNTHPTHLDQVNAGGLGIYFTKKIMDEIEYFYQNQVNFLIIRKKLN